MEFTIRLIWIVFTQLVVHGISCGTSETQQKIKKERKKERERERERERKS